jgi:two-component sensor histidine kinase/AmiR/NasT family two-component response regulator
MLNKNKKSILLVEDEVLIALDEKQQLETKGYIVQHITTGEKAVEVMRHPDSAFDLILMDIDLGSGIDGTQAAEKILEHQDIPIVFLSSHVEPEIVEKTEKISSYGYVTKSSGTVALDASIKMAIKLYNSRIETKQSQDDLLYNKILIEGILDGIPDVIGLQDIDHKIIRYNASGYEFVGKTPAEVDGKVKCFQLIGRDSPCEICATTLCYESKKNERVEKYLPESDTWLDVRAYPLIDSNGDILMVIEHLRDITVFKHAEMEIKKQLTEKEILLKEIHHRVKNNIANIESLLSLQANSTVNAEAKSILQKTITRVQSLRILYEKLLLSKNEQEISIKTYTEDLINSLLAVFEVKDTIIIERNIANFNISSRKMTSLGIIINELLANAFKYAFQDRDNGKVLISINKIKTRVTLIIQDNGTGIDERIILNKSPGLGLTLVKMLVDQLSGSYTTVNENGTKNVIHFEI